MANRLSINEAEESTLAEAGAEHLFPLVLDFGNQNIQPRKVSLATLRTTLGGGGGVSVTPTRTYYALLSQETETTIPRDTTTGTISAIRELTWGASDDNINIGEAQSEILDSGRIRLTSTGVWRATIRMQYQQTSNRTGGSARVLGITRTECDEYTKTTRGGYIRPQTSAVFIDTTATEFTHIFFARQSSRLQIYMSFINIGAGIILPTDNLNYRAAQGTANGGTEIILEKLSN